MARETYLYTVPQGNFTFSYEAYDSSPSVTEHLHESYEIYLFLKGKATYSVEGHLYEVEPNDIFITNNREIHAPIIHSKGEYARKLIFVHPSFLSEFVMEQFQPFDVLENRSLGNFNKLSHTAAAKSGVLEKFEEIEYYCRHALPESSAMIKCAMLQMLVQISHLLQIAPNPVKKHDKVHEIIHYINRNLSNDLSLKCLEQRFYINRYHLSHIFKEQTGYTIGAYITGKRIIRAKELLLNGTPLTEIAQMVGYHDYSSFYRAFKKVTGKAPGGLK